jgi:PAS domain S-box-containing protein
MDIQLKGSGDGVAAAGAIRERWDIPVVFVTANTNSEVMARAKASGPYGFLSKPFRPKELDATLSIALNQHKLSRALFAERGWLTTMLGSLSDGVIATDADGFVRFMNAAAEQITCWSAPQAVGLPIEAVYPLSTMDGVPVEHCQLRKALISREPAGKQRFLVHVRGDHNRPVEDSASPIIESGQLLGAVTIFLDITERLQKERSEAEMRERLEEQVQLTSQALGNTRQELQALSHHLMAAQEQERNRIARELHDDLGQRTAWLGLKTAALQSKAPTDLGEEIEALRQGLIELSSGLREVTHKLHPTVIEDLGLPVALKSLVNDLRAQDAAISATIDELPGLSVEVATALYRIAQESINNALKHAPSSPVSVRLWQEAGNVHLSIRDRGLGFSLADIRQKGGLGLVSMQERARLVGGTLLLSADPGKGTTVLVRVPL